MNLHLLAVLLLLALGGEEPLDGGGKQFAKFGDTIGGWHPGRVGQLHGRNSGCSPSCQSNSASMALRTSSLAGRM